MDASWRIRPIEWRIAWKHLRAGDDSPGWVKWLFVAAAFLLVLGSAFGIYAGVALAPEAGTIAGQPIFAGPTLSPEQQAFGSIGGVTIFIGYMLLVFAVLARFFNLLATIITFSVLLGCMALVIVLSLMSGLEGVLRDQILNQRAHLLVSRDDGNRFGDYEAVVEAIEGAETVAGASPYLEGEVMVRSGLNRQGALLIGIIPEKLPTVSNIDEIVKEGSYESLSNPEDIPDIDPLSFTRDETPWRLRHLDDESGGQSLRPRRNPPVGEQQGVQEQLEPDAEKPARDDPPDEPEAVDLPPPPPPFDEQKDEPTLKLGAGSGLDGLVPVPFEVPARDDGWEDPVAELGIGEVPTFKGPPRAPQDGLFGDGGWEDPEQELGLPPQEETPTEGDGDGEGSGDGDGEGPTFVLGEDAVLDPILIGRELAMELAVHVGANVQLVTPVGRMTPAGRMPGTLATRVGGVFFSGMYEYDRKNVYAPLPRVQAFLHSGQRVSGIEIKLHDVEKLAKGKAEVEAAVASAGRDELRVQTWQELNRNLFSAMLLEKIAMFVALLFVVLVASFGILASNLMSVLEKAKEIAILKAMGSSDLSIQRIFVAEGLCVGILGALGGIAIGLGMCFALDNYGLPLNENVYYMEQLPVVVNPFEVGLVGAAALIIVWLSSLYPARVASRMRPVDGLRHND
jgi:lipoprotein-releasing system permease protein